MNLTTILDERGNGKKIRNTTGKMQAQKTANISKFEICKFDFVKSMNMWKHCKLNIWKTFWKMPMGRHRKPENQRAWIDNVFLAYGREKSVSGIGLAIQPDIPLLWAETQRGLLVPAEGVDETEGRDTEPVGEEAIRWKWPTSTPHKDMTERWHYFQSRATLDNLEPNVSETSDAMRARQKVLMRAYRQVWRLHPPSRSWQLLLSGRETARTNNWAVVVEFMSVKTRNCCKTEDGIRKNRLIWTKLNFSLTSTVSRGIFGAWSQLCFSHLLSYHVSSCHPYECHSCQLWPQEDELHHVGLGDQLEDDDGCWRSEFCCSAKCSVQWKLNHSKYSCTAGSSLLFWRVHPLECRELLVLLLFEVLGALFASLYPGRSHNGPDCLFESRLRRWIRLTYRSLCRDGALWLISKCTMKSKYLTYTSVQLWVSWDVR